jgi:hypothetical protein
VDNKLKPRTNPHSSQAVNKAEMRPGVVLKPAMQLRMTGAINQPKLRAEEETIAPSAVARPLEGEMTGAVHGLITLTESTR